MKLWYRVRFMGWGIWFVIIRIMFCFGNIEKMLSLYLIIYIV